LKGTKNMRSDLEAKIVKLQDEQRKAEDKGDVVKADRLHAKIEEFYYKNS